MRFYNTFLYPSIPSGFLVDRDAIFEYGFDFVKVFVTKFANFDSAMDVCKQTGRQVKYVLTIYNYTAQYVVRCCGAGAGGPKLFDTWSRCRS